MTRPPARNGGAKIIITTIADHDGERAGKREPEMGQQGKAYELAVIEGMIRARLRGCSYSTVMKIFGVSRMTIAKHANNAIVERYKRLFADKLRGGPPLLGGPSELERVESRRQNA